ncbi:MAG: phenylalanine--tRNA ligase subunit beta [Patescibacteria group bacterium]
MQLSLDWLSDFVDISGISPEDLAELLTERVAEVEHIHSSGAGIENVVIGEIKKIEPIKDADKIQLTHVDIGSEELQIVCGAKNIHEGAKVPVALVGCVLPGGFKIEKRKVRGVESNGMICSEMELGLAEKSEGIMLLDKDAQVGEPFGTGGSSDVVFEIDNHAITHRPDLFGQLGFAREIAVLLGKKFESRELAIPAVSKKVDVEVAEPKLCPRYCALRISGIKVQPSPQKIQDRLEVCGVRAINNIVDTTNYVMLELGEPMHAFDAWNLKGGWIIVRRAKQGEKMKTLDGEERKLSEEMLVIADADKPVALAGVMGGENSEVDEKTTEIILEAATFDAVSVRRTSIKLGLRSESSLRFEKRLDPELPPKAIARAVEILRETCPELKIEAAADVKNFETKKRVIKLSLAKLSKKLGVAVKEEKAKEILTALEFKVVGASGELEVTVPSFRAGRDIEQEDDLIEEVIRHLGYADLPSDFPRIQMESPERDRARELADESRDAMVGYGFHETCTLALVSEKLLKDANQKLERAVRLKNPPSEDHRYLRNSLLASLLDVASRNIHNQKDFRLFEIATVFLKTEEESGELTYFAALVVNEEQPYPQVRGVLESLLRDLKFKAELAEAVPVAATAHPGRTADLKIAGKKIGMLAELHPAVAQKFELPRAAFFCLDFAMLAAAPRQVVVPEDLPRFPGVPRDLAVLVSEKTLAQDVENAISSTDEKICDLKLFDVYTGKGIPEGQKSLAFSFSIRDPEKTLEDAESEEIMQKVVANLEEIGGKLRS